MLLSSDRARCRRLRPLIYAVPSSRWRFFRCCLRDPSSCRPLPPVLRHLGHVARFLARPLVSSHVTRRPDRVCLRVPVPVPVSISCCNIPPLFRILSYLCLFLAVTSPPVPYLIVSVSMSCCCNIPHVRAPPSSLAACPDSTPPDRPHAGVTTAFPSMAQACIADCVTDGPKLSETFGLFQGFSLGSAFMIGG